MADGPTALYRALDADGLLLFAGGMAVTLAKATGKEQT